jgi:hypothetical protein
LKNKGSRSHNTVLNDIFAIAKNVVKTKTVMQHKIMTMKRTVLIFIAILQLATSFGQDNLKCYISTQDFANKTEYEKLVIPKIKLEGDEFVRISKMLNPSKKKDKLASTSWAIYFKDDYWINLRYSTEYQNPELFVKPKIIGKYTVIIINSETENVIQNGGTNYGGGLQGVLMKESDKWGKNWEDMNGNIAKILIFDTSVADMRHIRGHRNSIGKLLTRKNINEVLHQELEKEQIKSLKYEQVIELIKQENLNTLPYK